MPITKEDICELNELYNFIVDNNFTENRKEITLKLCYLFNNVECVESDEFHKMFDSIMDEFVKKANSQK